MAYATSSYDYTDAIHQRIEECTTNSNYLRDSPVIDSHDCIAHFTVVIDPKFFGHDKLWMRNCVCHTRGQVLGKDTIEKKKRCIQEPLQRFPLLQLHLYRWQKMQQMMYLTLTSLLNLLRYPMVSELKTQIINLNSALNYLLIYFRFACLLLQHLILGHVLFTNASSS